MGYGGGSAGAVNVGGGADEAVCCTRCGTMIVAREYRCEVRGSQRAIKIMLCKANELGAGCFT